MSHIDLAVQCLWPFGRPWAEIRTAVLRIERVLVAVLLLSLCPAGARADDGALAEALFQQAQTLMDEGQVDQACPKFAESQRLDPSTGTLLNLAYCHERQGKLATAWNEFAAALVLARRDGRQDRVEFAQEHVNEIEPKLSRLIIRLPKEHDAEGLQVRLAGTEVGRPAYGVALPVDPGVHELTVTAPGKTPWETTITVAPGAGTSQMNIPALKDAPEESVPAVGKVKSPAGAVEDEGGPKGPTRRQVAFGVGGLGLVGIGVGAAYGVVALSKNSQSNKQGCAKDTDICEGKGEALRNQALDAGNISTVAVIAGGALIGTAIVLYFTAPRKQRNRSTQRDEGHEVAPARTTSVLPRWAFSLQPKAGGGTLGWGGTW